MTKRERKQKNLDLALAEVQKIIVEMGTLKNFYDEHKKFKEKMFDIIATYFPKATEEFKAYFYQHCISMALFYDSQKMLISQVRIYDSRAEEKPTEEKHIKISIKV